VTDILHLSVALDAAGWHPAAWRAPRARSGALFTAGYWVDLVQEAEQGLLDFVTIEDSLVLQSSRLDGPDDRIDRVRGRLDAVLIAARVAPVTRHVGLVPTVTTTHTEPFHISKAIATLDYASTGRAGVQVRVGGLGGEAQHFGRRQLAPFRAQDRHDPRVRAQRAELFAEAADHVEVVRRLWDSWEDDAEIRDAATGRFIDRNKLHYIDFHGRWFSVRGPSITPRPPQGQPPVTALAHGPEAYRLAARAADVVFVTPHFAGQARDAVAEIRQQAVAGRDGDPPQVFADLVVFLDDDRARAAERKAGLDGRSGTEYRPDAAVFVGTPAQLADRLLAWRDTGLAGYRLRPGVLPDDLIAITRRLVPELQRRNAFRDRYQASTLRGLLGLRRPANRYATAT
jgi:alkanesulfonate monooxygenase SsuD/methylene tetrahydromethanopterin reductase-like flavin-dependent oxidoreductase (luciferase family)